MQHDSHPQIIKQLKQAQGQLASVLAMFGDGRPCVDLAQQLQAVESVVRNAKHTLIHEHLEHCIGEGGMTGDEALRELRALAKYL